MAASAQQTAGPQRLYRIGDVSRLTATKPFVLRFWETEFPMLQPVKTPKGHRLYRQEDVDLILAIKRLLYEEGFTIPGARRHLAEQLAGGTAIEPGVLDARLPLVSIPTQPATPEVGEGRGTVPHLPDAPAISGHVTAEGSAVAPVSARIAPRAQETLRAVREELRAILTLLGAG